MCVSSWTRDNTLCCAHTVHIHRKKSNKKIEKDNILAQPKKNKLKQFSIHHIWRAIHNSIFSVRSVFSLPSIRHSDSIFPYSLLLFFSFDFFFFAFSRHSGLIFLCMCVCESDPRLYCSRKIILFVWNCAWKVWASASEQTSKIYTIKTTIPNYPRPGNRQKLRFG